MEAVDKRSLDLISPADHGESKRIRTEAPSGGRNSPTWHAPWKLYRVISGHQGAVRSVAFDPGNTWFCTGSADRTIKIWDVASGRLSHTLTGHIGQVRGLAVSHTRTYMFSAGDDKQVKCWDLEQNKTIRSYSGPLSGVYCLALHPTVDVLLGGGRDSVCRAWDVRVRTPAMTFVGHSDTVCTVLARPTDPQVITGSHDSTIKFWDLRYATKGAMTTLTHHKKSVRALATHSRQHNTFASASSVIKKFSLPRGVFIHNLTMKEKGVVEGDVVNAMAVNGDGVLVAGGDNGSLCFWDWTSGYNFQRTRTVAQPGSLESEAGIYAASFDVTGSRLVTCEADKTIKMWKEDDQASPESHPIKF